MNLNDALEKIEEIEPGNSLFFFDPLRSVKYTTINEVASKRIQSFYQTGTEFFIFLYTSDWFLGRDEFVPLPSTPDESSWSEDEKRTVLDADSLFGAKKWRRLVLNNKPIEDREKTLIELYKYALHKWFRYVLPLPFNPKKDQIFHLILCSNYEAGVKATKDFYCKITGNPKYSPNNKKAYERFKSLHSEALRWLNAKKRPLQWRALWKIITQHEDGICDCMCSDFKEIARRIRDRQQILYWLEHEGYIIPFRIKNAWKSSIGQYKLNWKIVKKNLGIDPPSSLKPPSPGEI